MMQRHQVNRHPKPDPRSALSDCRKDHQRRRHHRKARRKMHLSQPHRIEPKYVSLRGFRDQLAIPLRSILTRTLRKLVEEIELHRITRLSVPTQSRRAFAMKPRRAEIRLVEARAFEPQMHILLPGEADSAMHQHRAVGPAAVDIAEPRLRHRGLARGLVRSLFASAMSRIPEQRATRLEIGDNLGRRML